MGQTAFLKSPKCSLKWDAHLSGTVVIVFMLKIPLSGTVPAAGGKNGFTLQDTKKNTFPEGNLNAKSCDCFAETSAVILRIMMWCNYITLCLQEQKIGSLIK